MTTDPNQPEAQEAPASEPSHYAKHDARLRSALERVTYEFCRVLAGKPVRNADEIIAECDAALGKQPTQEAPGTDVVNYFKAIYAFLESTAPDGFALEAFRLPPSPTLSQRSLFDAAQGYALGERPKPARQDQGVGRADEGAVAQEAPADAKDAARYRWLRDPTTDALVYILKQRPWPAMLELPQPGSDIHSENLDAAIDSALQSHQEGK